MNSQNECWKFEIITDAIILTQKLKKNRFIDFLISNLYLTDSFSNKFDPNQSNKSSDFCKIKINKS